MVPCWDGDNSEIITLVTYYSAVICETCRYTLAHDLEDMSSVPVIRPKVLARNVRSSQSVYDSYIQGSCGEGTALPNIKDNDGSYSCLCIKLSQVGISRVSSTFVLPITGILCDLSNPGGRCLAEAPNLRPRQPHQLRPHGR